MFDPNKILTEIRSGISFVCATCDRYWEGKELIEQGRAINFVQDGQRCTARTKCGSPLVGDVFSQYKGPLLDSLQNFCFVCGEPSKYGLRVGNLVRSIGACAAHVRWFEQSGSKWHEWKEAEKSTDSEQPKNGHLKILT